MGRARNLAKLVLEKNLIASQSLHNALTAISDEANNKTDFIQIPLTDGKSKSNAGSVRLTTQGLESFNGSNWSSLISKTEVLHSVSGSIINGYSTVLTIDYDSASATNDVIFYKNGTEIHRQRETTPVGKNKSINITVDSSVYNQSAGSNIQLFIQTPQNFVSDKSITLTVVSAASGGSVSKSGNTFTHVFTSNSTFYSNGTKYCEVHCVGRGGNGGAGISEHNSLARSNYFGGGGGGGGHLTKWSGNVSKNTSVDFTSFYSGLASLFGNVEAGSGGGGADYNSDAWEGTGGGGGGGAGDKYDPSYWSSDEHHEYGKKGVKGGGDGADGDGTYGGGGGGGNGSNAHGSTGGAGTWSSLFGATVGRGGDGGGHTSGGKNGVNIGDGGQGGSNGGGGGYGQNGAVAVRYTVS